MLTTMNRDSIASVDNRMSFGRMSAGYSHKQRAYSLIKKVLEEWEDVLLFTHIPSEDLVEWVKATQALQIT